VTLGAILLKDPVEWFVLLLEGINKSALIKILNLSVGIDALFHKNI
jgi:hypothetical protein